MPNDDNTLISFESEATTSDNYKKIIANLDKFFERKFTLGKLA